LRYIGPNSLEELVERWLVVVFTVALSGACIVSMSGTFSTRMQVAEAGPADTFRAFPLSPQVTQFLRDARAPSRATGISARDYLAVAGGIVRFFQTSQDANGAIIDPFEKRERQYATPAFACAAAALVASGMAPEMRAPAERAYAWAAKTLSEGQAADHHEDFFTVLLMHAHEMLAGRRDAGSPKVAGPPALPGIPPFDPLKVYRDVKDTPHNWNVVAISGEFLRLRAGFSASDAFVEGFLGRQLANFNEFGMYRDPNDPMAYDLFPRLWLSDMLAHGYAGRHQAALEALLERGALASLFMQSPLGELPAGGRSGAHQWNEAQQAATFEIMAQRFANGTGIHACPGQARPRDRRECLSRLAGAFKRAARLALLSLRRWVRPSGELWIVKNRFAPEERFGYDSYSFHSQYNLLAAAMLAIAWRYADENIVEGATPAETGGFAFQVRSGFDKVFANAAGSFVEYELNGDPHYNPTGIIRVHFPGGALLNDGAVAHPSYTTARYQPSISLALGPVWESAALSDRARSAAGRPDVRLLHQDRGSVEFEVSYADSACSVSERVSLRPGAVRVKDQVSCAKLTGANIPFLVTDGARTFDAEPGVNTITHNAKARRLRVAVPTRYGLLDAIRIEAPGNTIEYEVGPLVRRTGR
jgi:hypothetical protein